ncbi:MAG: alpha/beta hydrolase [Planctomycetes bacterium]|nr:alpha/beta hydrolase [Planctomycetota bacterium]
MSTQMNADMNTDPNADPNTGIETVLFKSTPQADLQLHIFRPDGPIESAIVFFACGGWDSIRVEKFFPQSTYLQSRGVFSVVADVRTYAAHGTTATECVIDAKSAIRFVRAHAEEWGFAADKICVAGGSAAGHVSMCCAMLDEYEDENDDTDVSCKPDLVCAFNPAVLPPLEDDGKDLSWTIERFGSEEMMKALSPCEAVRPGIVPMVLMHGDADDITLLSDIEYFHQKMLAAGNSSTLHVFPGGKHGFCGYDGSCNPHFVQSIKYLEDFLCAHKFLSGESTIDQFSYNGAYED